MGIIGLAVFALVVGFVLINKLTPPEVGQNKENVISITSGTQGRWKDISIAVGNIRSDEVTKTLSAVLYISGSEDKNIRLHMGEEAVVGKYKIKVIEIKSIPDFDPKPGSDKSYVTLELTKLD